MSRVRTLIVTVVSVVTICFSAVPARVDTNTEDLNQELPDGVTVQVMTTDADVLAQRALTLRQSPALLRYLASQTDDVDAALIDIAMIATDEGIRALIENTRGMKFVSDSSSNLGVKLVPENVIAMEDLGGAPVPGASRDTDVCEELGRGLGIFCGQFDGVRRIHCGWRGSRHYLQRSVLHAGHAPRLQQAVQKVIL